ncbi:glycosyltransferase [Enterococcus sp. LJL98]
MNFFVNKAMGIGNSGVEHAQFYREKCFKEAQLEYKYVFTEFVHNLSEAMKAWKIPSDKVINMWEFFVFGKEYLTKGPEERYELEEEVLIDDSQTHREKRLLTSTGVLWIEHLEKSVSKKNKGLLLVSGYKVEMYEYETMKRKVMYEIIDHPRRGRLIQNIHLFDMDGEYLFFRNEVTLQRFFFQYLRKSFEGKINFILDRGQESESALFYEKPENSSLVEVIHADHLSDRDVPSAPLWNNHYEYLFTHMEQVDRVIVSTELQREDLLIEFPEEQEKIVTIPVGGIRNQVEDASPSCNEITQPFKLITASRLASEKHLDIVIRAIVSLKEEYPRLELDIYGQGGEDVKLKQLIQELDAADYIRLKGLSHHLEEVYRNYDAFISGSYSEGFGLTYIEALDAGLPIVTFKARFGALELVQDGVTGYLQEFSRTDEEFSVRELAKGVQKLLQTDYHQMKKNTRISVKEFQDSVISEKWRNLIDAL